MRLYFDNFLALSAVCYYYVGKIVVFGANISFKRHIIASACLGKQINHH